LNPIDYRIKDGWLVTTKNRKGRTLIIFGEANECLHFEEEIRVERSQLVRCHGPS